MPPCVISQNCSELAQIIARQDSKGESDSCILHDQHLCLDDFHSQGKASVDVVMAKSVNARYRL
jgi:hypothetical protein